MTKVYLDNNVFVDIETGKYSFEDFLTRPNTYYYYSDAHLEELLEAKGNTKVSQEERLELITRLCDRNYICSGVINKPEFLEKDCREMYKLVDNRLRVLINIATMAMSKNIDKMRERLDFDSRSFNNEKAERVLGVIDLRMKEKLGIGLMEYLYKTEAFGGRALYGTLMNVVDMANYWKDSRTFRSDVARLYDASHAYSAQICDLLVTSDKRMREKVRVVYSFLGVKTIIVSVDEFFKTQVV